jgi:hypothetical protein
VVAPGETLISVPATCQLRYTGDQSPQLQQLLQQVPKAAGSSHGAWQFKMAIQVCGVRLIDCKLIAHLLVTAPPYGL